VGGDDAPALRKSHPSLHLPPDLPRLRRPIVQGRGDRIIPAVGGNDGPRQRALKTDRRARSAKRLNFIVAIQNFGAAITDCARIVVKNGAERGYIVLSQRMLVTFKLRANFSDDIRQVNLHSDLHTSTAVVQRQRR